LGALLYEMLTLQSPVDKTGGFHAILQRVRAGAIVPPEMRVPARTRRIPPELSAVAMKALARDKQDRYPSVEALRRDIDRYLEGRSVSVKDDTRRQQLWKLIKRNKGFSAGAALALLVLLCSLGFSGSSVVADEPDERGLSKGARGEARADAFGGAGLRGSGSPGRGASTFRQRPGTGGIGPGLRCGSCRNTTSAYTPETTVC
jgi:serine/threonine protein kinase